MKSLLESADEIPVTLVVALAYVTLAFLTDPFHPTGEALERFGWLSPMRAPGEPWRLLSHAFLHGGIVHLLFNLMMLLSIGPALERSLGSLRYGCLYAVAALGGGIAVCLFQPPPQPVVGGSGALFGMMGALVASNMRGGRHVFAFLDFEGPRRLLALIAANLVIGFVLPFISNTAHIGGLLAGFAVTFLWLDPGRQPGPSLWRWRWAMTALFASLSWASLQPVTRFDWLYQQSLAQPDRDRRAALQRAAVMDLFDRPSASDLETAILPQLFEPEPGDRPARRPR